MDSSDDGYHLGQTGTIISNTIGWLYFIAWSVSFYPQIYINWRRKSVIGLSFDYEAYNIIGFLCYSVFVHPQFNFHNFNTRHSMSPFTLTPTFKASTKKRMEIIDVFLTKGKSNLVTLNDVVFALHATAATIVTIIQIFIYEKGGQRVSRVCTVICGLILLSILIVALVSTAKALSWIWFFYYLSTVKLAITLIKYCPQVYLNFKRKSTSGWSIGNVLLDFSGGLLSIVQLIFDGWRKDNWAGVIGDPVKFGLGFVSMVFDIIFMIQHYGLYKLPVERKYTTLTEDENGSRPLNTPS